MVRLFIGPDPCSHINVHICSYHPYDAVCRLVLGMAFERAAQSERAAECFLRAVERDGRNPLRDFAVALIEA